MLTMTTWNNISYKLQYTRTFKQSLYYNYYNTQYQTNGGIRKKTSRTELSVTAMHSSRQVYCNDEICTKISGHFMHFVNAVQLILNTLSAWRVEITPLMKSVIVFRHIIIRKLSQCCLSDIVLNHNDIALFACTWNTEQKTNLQW